jgi:hypothetical protein
MLLGWKQVLGRSEMYKVIYDELHQRALLCCLLDQFLRFYEVIDYSRAILDARRLAILDTCMCFVSACTKDISFKEEFEVRLVCYSSAHIDAAAGVDFRYDGRRILPYVRLKPNEGRGKLPIKEVIVGPCSDQKLVTLGVTGALPRYGYNQVDVRLSRIPYRP